MTGAGICPPRQGNGARHLLVISSLGANPDSSIFYLKVKGEMEAALQQQDWPQLTIARPSQLLGPRLEMRLSERIAAPLSQLLPASTTGSKPAPWRGRSGAWRSSDGVRIVESDELRKLGK